MPRPVTLGEVTAPSGAIVVIDPGMLHYGFWRGDRNPHASAKLKGSADFAIEGPDGEKAGAAFERQWHPRYLFDWPAKSADFDKFVQARGFDAHLRRLRPAVTHRTRVDLAIAQGNGGGEIVYSKLWAAAVGGLPTDRKMQVVATPMDGQEFSGRWKFIDLVVDGALEVERTEEAGLVMVDYGMLLFADADGLGAWKHKSLDGLADFVFWGQAAPDLAATFGADALDGGNYGWMNLPVEAAGEKAQLVQDQIQREKLRAGVDWRPHSHGHLLMSSLRASTHRSGTITLGDAILCGFDNRWGDGLFEVQRCLSSNGQLVRVRIDAGTEKRQAVMRAVAARR